MISGRKSRRSVHLSIIVSDGYLHETHLRERAAAESDAEGDADADDDDWGW